MTAETTAAPAHGLVTCATTCRVRTAGEETAGQSVARETAFPTPELVSAAASLYAKRPGWDGSEGPRPVLTVAPGVVSIGWPDVARRERTAERFREATRKRVDEEARYYDEHGKWRKKPDPKRVVGEWSAKSRARMVRTLAELDYAPMLKLGMKLPMTTLTYPGDWLAVASSGKDVKQHMDKFYKRFLRAWGFTWLGIWKLEFQRRGAPHIHLWGPAPDGAAGDLGNLTKVRRRYAVGDGLPYAQWLSVVWADIVDHPDPEERRKHEGAGTAVDVKEGARMSDPRRLAVYFTKHGSFADKEYQHVVPEEWREPGKTPGRFWGYKGLEKATAGVELEPADAVFAARVLRRLARSQGVTRQVSVPRGEKVDPVTGEIRIQRRKVRRPVVRLKSGAGFLCVNDGPALAASVARALERGRS